MGVRTAASLKQAAEFLEQKDAWRWGELLELEGRKYWNVLILSESATKKYEHARKGALGADIKNFMKSYFVDHAKNIFDGFLAARKGNIFGAGKALYSIIDDDGFIDRSKSAKNMASGLSKDYEYYFKISDAYCSIQGEAHVFVRNKFNPGQSGPLIRKELLLENRMHFLLRMSR